MPQLKSKADAQLRADQIGHFQAELAIIEQERILSLDESQRAALAGYHENLLQALATKFDIDSEFRGQDTELLPHSGIWFGICCASYTRTPDKCASAGAMWDSLNLPI